jgi:hypothetical protein
MTSPIAPIPRIDHWVQISINCLQEGTERILTHNYYSTEAQPSPAELLAAATRFKDYPALALQIMCAQTVRFVSVKARSLTTGTNYEAEVPFGSNTYGQRVFDPLPANASLVVSWKTAQIGRSYRGRNFLFGLTEVDSSGSMVNAEYLGLVAQYATLVLNFHNADSPRYTLAVASRKLLNLATVTNFVVDNIVDSQRRRLPLRGR